MNEHKDAYLHIRAGMALLAFVFPLVFILPGVMWHLFADSVPPDLKLLPTISDYYHHDWDFYRNFFVGSMIAIGFFLFIYKDTKKPLISGLLTVAGFLEICAAFIPTTPDSTCGDEVTMHGIFGISFFVLLLLACGIGVYKSLNEIREKDKEDADKIIRYYCYSGAMICFLIVAAILYAAAGKVGRATLCENYLLLYFEVFGVWAFALFWYTKTRELNRGASWNPAKLELKGVQIEIEGVARAIKESRNR